MSIIKGDFLGFTFNGIHSSELGIFRIAEGARYADDLAPTTKDNTINIPGGDGTYYFGSFHTQKEIVFSIAFDDLTESQLRRLKTIFSDKKTGELILDEVPYKVYKVKATGKPNLKYICFDRERDVDFREDELGSNSLTRDDLYGAGAQSSQGRVYKGEGQLFFTAHNPYAKSRKKFLDEYTVKNIPEWGSMGLGSTEDIYQNFYEWIDSSRLISSTTTATIGESTVVVDEVIHGQAQNNGVLVYNAGDLPADFIFQLIFPVGIVDVASFSIEIPDAEKIVVGDLKLLERDRGIQINTKLNLIEGINELGQITGQIYNRYISAGDFFKIPVKENPFWMPIIGMSEDPTVKIIYDYLYY